MKLPTSQQLFASRHPGRSDGAGSDPAPDRLIPVDRAVAQPRPDAIASTYLESRYDALSAEQVHLFAAQGLAAARPYAATAKAGEYPARKARDVADLDKTVVDKARIRFEQTRELLTPYVHRKSTSSVGYTARLGGLLLGDVAGLTGAAIALGEYPALAITQAISAGTATITAGLAGAELKHRQHAAGRRRESDSLPTELGTYRHLFDDDGRGRAVHVGVTVAAALVALFVAVGVYALRTVIEGSLSGLTFGALAAAIAIASFINSWYHADLVADAIDSAQRDYRRAARSHQRLAATAVVMKTARGSEQERSILAEYDQRGRAASARIEALKYQALSANPDVVGHGPAATSVGRKPRRAGESS